MAVPHDEILITIIPDAYRIRFAGKTADGRQVMVTPDLSFDPKTETTTDYVVVYRWDPAGNFLDAQITTLGVRGQYDQRQADEIHREIEGSVRGFVSETLRVKPCRVRHGGVEFGFIPRTEDGLTTVELMPGNCLCFLEPFDGGYDT